MSQRFADDAISRESRMRFTEGGQLIGKNDLQINLASQEQCDLRIRKGVNGVQGPLGLRQLVARGPFGAIELPKSPDALGGAIDFGLRLVGERAENVGTREADLALQGERSQLLRGFQEQSVTL